MGSCRCDRYQMHIHWGKTAGWLVEIALIISIRSIKKAGFHSAKILCWILWIKTPLCLFEVKSANQSRSYSRQTFIFSIHICKCDYIVINQSSHSSQITSGSLHPLLPLWFNMMTKSYSYNLAPYQQFLSPVSCSLAVYKVLISISYMVMHLTRATQDLKNIFEGVTQWHDAGIPVQSSIQCFD